MRYRFNHPFIVAAGLAGLAALGPAAASAATAVPEAYAMPATALDTTKPGFVVRVFQATGPELENTIARAENQIAGYLINPATGQPFTNIADLSQFNADGTYDETGTIAYYGGFFPGIPGTETTTINIALEAITFVEYQPGTYAMVITGDDGAKLTVGNVYDRLQETVLVESPSTADKVATFTITKAGVYAFRVVYEQGGGGYALNWYTADPADTSARTLLNDPSGKLSYRALKAGAVTLGPTISALQPLPNATGVTPSAGIKATLRDGSTALNLSSVKVFYNGTDVTASATIGPKSGNSTLVTYKPAVRPEPLAVESYKLTFQDPTAANGTREAVISYTVAPYANYTLPAPIWLENFDGVAEGQMPAGWTTTSPIPPVGFEDLSDPSSDSYRTWVVISKQRVADLGTAGKWNAADRLNTPEVYINGAKVESLIDKQFAYLESDVRSGSQYAELFSPAINLTGKTDVYLVYNSIYTQNQDNVAGVEYSVDDGATWLPVVYMIDEADIIKNAAGDTDAVSTLTATQSDTAQYTDPVTGETIGLTYGAFVKAPTNTWANLGPYISGRVNDDQMESKRIEKFRLPQADNKASVKLRFFYAGTGSWFFGVDNVGLYSIVGPQAPTITAPPVGGVISAGTKLTLSVVATGTAPLTYQWKLNGTDIAGATSDTYVVSSVAAANSGDYVVEVKNAGGSVKSLKATVVVFTGTIADNLVVHLKLDGNLSDSSGRGNAATAVGTLEYVTGKVGAQAVHIASSADYASLGTPADLNFGTTNDFSFSFWTKAVTWSGDPAFISNKDWNSGGNQGYVLATDSDGHFQWNLAGAPGGRKDYDGPPGTFSDGAWHYVVVTFQRNGTATTFVDGVRKDSRPLTADQNNVDTPTAMATNIGQDGTGAYGSSFTDVALDDIGIWRRVVTPQEVAAIYEAGLAGKDLSQAVVKPGEVPPTITQQPKAVTIEQGLSATFSVTATGTEPFTYEWKKNGTTVAGATTSALALSNVQPADAGNYSVKVSNGAGFANSDAVALTVTPPAPVVVTGQWDFNNDDLSATVGNPLTYFDATVQADTQFGTTTSFGIGNIGGSPAHVMKYSPSVPKWGGYVMPHGAVPNGGGAYVNRYSIVWDVYYPAESNGKYRVLLQTNTGDSNDGDLFINTGNGVGISSKYEGTVPADAWTRIVAVFDLTTATLKKYINGTLVGTQTLSDGTDGRWSLDPTALLFGDDDGDNALGYVNSVQFRNGVMTDAEVAALGGVTADAIPGAAPRISSIKVSGTSVTITWPAAPSRKLQQATKLPATGWTDVPGTLGAGSATVQTTGASGFFRLAE